jgi:hypothetical protein
MSWSYIKSNFPGEELYTVVVLNAAGEVVASDSDWPTRDEARRRVVILNGGNPDLLKIDSPASRARDKKTARVPTPEPEPQALARGPEGDGHWFSPRQLAERLDFITWGQLQWWLNQRKENGLSSAVRRVGKRKLLISESLFFEWINQQRE